MKTPTQLRTQLEAVRLDVLQALKEKLETVHRVEGLKSHYLKAEVEHECGPHDDDFPVNIIGIFYDLSNVEVTHEGEDYLLPISDIPTDQLIKILEQL